MRTRQLGSTDLHLTRIGFGAWAVGGPGYAFGWGPQEDNDSILAIQHALDAGINWIDTAPVYGLGHSEEIVARALTGRDRSKVVIATKCTMRWDDKGEIRFDFSKESVRHEIEESLRRLKTDYVDLYQAHWPNDDARIEEGWGEMAKLVAEGKVRHIGLSNFSIGQMERCRKIHPIASLQPPYSMLVRGVEKNILPYCLAHRIGVVAYSPMRNGLLTGKYDREKIAELPKDDWRHRNDDFKEPNLTANLEMVSKLKTLANQTARTAAQAAVAWVLAHPAVTSAIVGARNPAQIEELLPAADWELGSREKADLDALIAQRDARLKD